jgi:putative tryptophan/tyrosine transport system substrate-binding protein
MNRRAFISLIGGAAATWPLAARAQSKTRVIGFLGANTPAAAGHLASEFVKRLRDLGWVEGVMLRSNTAGQPARQ